MEIFYNKSVTMQNMPNFVSKIDMGFMHYAKIINNNPMEQGRDFEQWMN